VSTINTTVKNRQKVERRYVQCEPLSKQWKSLKHSPPEKLESGLAAWFKQACESNAFLDGIHLKENALHIATYLGLTNFLASSGWIAGFKRPTLFTELCQVRAGVLIHKL
jgi:hypothetical protein